MFIKPEISLDQCIKCNICTTVCPVSAVTDLFPGPKYEGPQAGRFRNPVQSSPDRSVDYCSGCRACDMACPTGVKIAEINSRARASMVKQGKINLRHRLRNNLLARPETLGKVGHNFASIANHILENNIIRQVSESTLGIHHLAPLPKFSNDLFTRWFRNHPKPVKPKRKVVYFHGCATQFYEPRIGRAAVRVLEANGCEVIVPPQNCCGLPLLSNGEYAAARRYHQNNIRNLVDYARQGIPIIGTSTSCTLTIKEEAPELLDMTDEDTQLVSKNTYDFNEYLLLLHQENLLNLQLTPVPITLVYHIPCQYRAHRLGKPGVEILNLIPDLVIQDSKAVCCGIAGTYGYKEEKYKISMEIGQPLFNVIDHDLPDGPFVICDSETCRWQITHATGKPAVHPAELLAKAYGLPVEGVMNELQA
jgi:glycerol-3-phosphate dehydrogenase subunit C